jgi:hypothetical protein
MAGRVWVDAASMSFPDLPLGKKWADCSESRESRSRSALASTSAATSRSSSFQLPVSAKVVSETVHRFRSGMAGWV